MFIVQVFFLIGIIQPKGFCQFQILQLLFYLASIYQLPTLCQTQTHTLLTLDYHHSFCFHTVHGVLKARRLEWFASPFSNGPYFDSLCSYKMVFLSWHMLCY